VRLQDFHPVGRFGASFYVKTGERFAIASAAAPGAAPEGAHSTAIDEM
jgi:hypothetical protein